MTTAALAELLELARDHDRQIADRVRELLRTYDDRIHAAEAERAWS